MSIPPVIIEKFGDNLKILQISKMTLFPFAIGHVNKLKEDVDQYKVIESMLISIVQGYYKL